MESVREFNEKDKSMSDRKTLRDLKQRCLDMVLELYGRK